MLNFCDYFRKTGVGRVSENINTVQEFYIWQGPNQTHEYAAIEPGKVKKETEYKIKCSVLIRNIGYCEGFDML